MRPILIIVALLVALAAPASIHAHGFAASATVYLKLDTGAGDAAFQAVMYIQNVATGETASYPLTPHAPPLLAYIPVPGTYVFYARLVEAMDDYFFGATGREPGGASPRRGLLAVDVEQGKEYEVLVNDRSVRLPEKGKPVSVPWHSASRSWGESLAIVEAFYDLIDAGQTDDALSLLTDNCEVALWAEGINGRHWQERHFVGKEQIRPALGGRGLHLRTDSLDSPIYVITEVKLDDPKVMYRLRPDRRSPDGRPYDPFTVRAEIEDGRIRTLAIAEFLAYL